MSALRTCLLAATVLGVALASAPECRAQAYGARSVVEHNDLRWFEPTELDLDGQMPRDKAGFFFTFDKLNWWTSNPKTEIGHPGLTVDSERIYRAPSVDLAFTALQQGETLGFIDSLSENLNYTGIQFVLADTRGTDSLTDDIVSPFDTSIFANAAALEVGIRAFNNDPANIAANQQIRVGGEPRPYQVRNGIRDALPDAGLAWGERIEFGYSDGERGWMITVLDGPEARAGGTWGVRDAPYTSQSETDIPGPDPNFASDLTDDDGDGRLDGDGELGAVDLFALGFGSVAVNFNLPTDDFLLGYRDYFNNDAGPTSGTTSGPVLYVGNYGTVETDLQVVDIGTGGGTGGTVAVSAAGAIALTNNFNTQQGTADPAEALLIAQLTGIMTELNELNRLITIGVTDDDEAVAAAFETAAVQLGQASDSADALEAALLAAIAADPNDMVAMNQFDAEVAALLATLTALDGTVTGLLVTVDVDGDGGDQDVDVEEQNRRADDLDGNGNAGVTVVLADVDGDGVIEEGEVIALINNFGDLHEFNVFFDQVTVRNTTEMDGVELMRTNQISTRHRLEQGRWDDLRFSYGVRFVSLDDNFFFQGLGSILGRTTVETNVENQIIGPQLGVQWVRRDGPWDFVLEGRGTLGYNMVDVDQEGYFGEEAIPGALNRSATARLTTSVDGQVFDEFSPLAELRAQLRYRLADAVTLQAGYTAKYIGNIHRGGQATAWNAPDFGVLDNTGDIFINGLNFGIELRH